MDTDKKNETRTEKKAEVISLSLAQAVNAVKEQIEYDTLMKNHASDKETIDAMAHILVELKFRTSGTMKVSGTPYPVDVVRDRMEQVGYEHVEYVLECLEKSAPEIRNIRSYLVSALFNAPATIGGYYEAMVRHDMPHLMQG